MGRRSERVMSPERRRSAQAPRAGRAGPPRPAGAPTRRPSQCGRAEAGPWSPPSASPRSRPGCTRKMGDQTLGLQLGSRVLPHRERFGDLAQCRSSALDGSRRGEDSVLGGGRPLRLGRQRAGPVDGGSPRLIARSVGTRRSGRCVCCCVSHSPSLSPRALWRRGCQQGDVKGRPVNFLISFRIHPELTDTIRWTATVSSV